MSDYRLLYQGGSVGNIVLPASKSISNRVLLMRALSQAQQPIYNVADCEDTTLMAKALVSTSTTKDVGAAGTAMRFLTAYYACCPGQWLLTGTERMKQRPIALLVEALRSIGAEISYTEKEGYPPLKITGRPLTGGEIDIYAGVSSQYLSALLMLAPYMQQGLVLHWEGALASQPYVEMTLQLMKQFGVQSVWEGNRISVAPQHYKDRVYTVESDWSAASYWYEFLAVSPLQELRLHGLLQDSLQGDSRVVQFFGQQLGVQTEFLPDGDLRLYKAGTLTNTLSLSLDGQPDLAQTLVLTCCLLGIPFTFTGLHSLRIKETDRIVALITETAKLGYVLTALEPGGLRWDGSRQPPVSTPSIATYKDHRMAMAFAPAAVRFPGLQVEDAVVVNKSYPGYWQALQAAGMQLNIIT